MPDKTGHGSSTNSSKPRNRGGGELCGGYNCMPKKGKKLAGNICEICKLHISDENDAWEMHCGHIFHGTCVEFRCRRNTDCPNCGGQLRSFFGRRKSRRSKKSRKSKSRSRKSRSRRSRRSRSRR